MPSFSCDSVFEFGTSGWVLGGRVLEVCQCFVQLFLVKIVEQSGLSLYELYHPVEVFELAR